MAEKEFVDYDDIKEEETIEEILETETIETEESETTKEEQETEEKKKPLFKLEGVNDLKRLHMISMGEDPDRQQTITDFLKMDNPIERTNLPDTTTVLTMAKLTFVGEILFPDRKDNALSKLGDHIATAFMARKGEKANQFVDIVRNQPDLSGLQSTVEQEPKKGRFDVLLGRRYPE